jgi:hypothetical protein
VEGKRPKRKSQLSEILPGTTYKTFLESKGKGKARKLQGKTELQLKWLEAAQKKEKSGGLKPKKYDKAKTEPSQAIYFHVFISRLCGMWRDIRE